MIKKLYVDIDGVMTKGKKHYDVYGNVTHKEFNDKDFTAIKTIKKLGVDVVFLSGDRRVNEQIANQRKITFIFSRNKLDDVKKIEKYFKGIAYIGDDLPDIPLLDAVEYSFCPGDANFRVLSCSDYHCRNGGDGVLMDVLEHIIYINDQEIDFSKI